MKTKRLSGIELLRLFAMFGIVLSHWGGHGSWQLESDNTYLYNKVFLQFTQYLGEIGNCIFILITGYFCANKTEISKDGLIRVITDVKVYAFVMWGVVVMLGFVPFTIMGGAKISAVNYISKLLVCASIFSSFHVIAMDKSGIIPGIK